MFSSVYLTLVFHLLTMTGNTFEVIVLTGELLTLNPFNFNRRCVVKFNNNNRYRYLEVIFINT